MTEPLAASIRNADEAFWTLSSPSSGSYSIAPSGLPHAFDHGAISKEPTPASKFRNSKSRPIHTDWVEADRVAADRVERDRQESDTQTSMGHFKADETDAETSDSDDLEEIALSASEVDASKVNAPKDASDIEAAMADAAIATFSTKAVGYQKTMSDDAVGAFLKDMARYPLLRADEEVELARNVKFLNDVESWRDRYTDEQGRHPTDTEIANAFELTPQQLRKQLHLGHTSKRTMIRSNLRLVVSIAKRYLNRGVPFLDLIQEGALGLNRATEKFDPDKGYKFSTYAYWWIRQGITRTIANDARTIRLPIHIVEKLNKLKKAHRDLRRQLNRNPTEAELAAVLDTNLQQLRSLQQVRRSALSLNHRVGKGEDTELLELLEDHNALTPEDQINDSMMRQDVCTVLSDVLTEREQEIITLRYGITTGEPCTLEEVGNMFNLSRERVRQIQTKAMRKLRRPQVASRLKNWLR